MAHTMTSTRRSSAPRRGLLSELFTRARQHHASRLAHRQLQSLDDHLLRDIGIDRAAIDEVLRNGRR